LLLGIVVVTEFEDRGRVGGDLPVIATFAGETAAGCNSDRVLNGSTSVSEIVDVVVLTLNRNSASRETARSLRC
jgi:hypothetical protein